MRLLLPVERLVAALVDPARRERAVIAVLAGYVVVWTLYGALAKASQDLHFDMSELAAWARAPALGYPKHPPLAPWLVGAWFSLWPAADWAYYLLAIATAALTLWVAWRVSGRFLDGEKHVLALALLTLVPFFNFHALKLNINTMLLPLWAATTLWFLRSFATRHWRDAALVGLGAAACMLGKYWSIFLLAGLGLTALLDPRRGDYFRSVAPWITIAVGALGIAPHVAWLIAHDFPPFAYAVTSHATSSLAVVATSIAGYLAGAAGYVALPVLLAFAANRPSRAALADMLAPETAERRFAAVAFWAPLLLPALVAPFIGMQINSLWTMAGWTLLPVVLLSSPLIHAGRAATVRIVALAIAFPLVMLLAAPLIAGAIHRAGVAPSAAHARLLAQQVALAWHEMTDRPLPFVGGESRLAYGVAFYLPGTAAFPDLDPRYAPWIDPARLARAGVALVCPAADHACIGKIEAHAGATGQRREVELVRHYLGFAGPPARYLIIIVPPQPP